MAEIQASNSKILTNIWKRIFFLILGIIDEDEILEQQNNLKNLDDASIEDEEEESSWLFFFFRNLLLEFRVKVGARDWFSFHLDT